MVGRTFLYVDDQGSDRWVDKGKSWLVKASLITGLAPLALQGGVNTRHAYRLRELVGDDQKVLLLPTHFSEFDPVAVASSTFAATGRALYQVGNGNLPSFLQHVNLIPLTRRKDLFSRLKRSFSSAVSRSGFLSSLSKRLFNRESKDSSGNGSGTRREHHNDARLRRRLVYDKIVPALLRQDYGTGGEIVGIYPQGSISSQDEPKGIDEGTLGNIVGSVQRVEREVYAVPVRVSYDRNPRLVSVGGKSFTLPRFGSRVTVSYGSPFVMNHYGDVRDMRTSREVLESELEGLLGSSGDV